MALPCSHAERSLWFQCGIIFAEAGENWRRAGHRTEPTSDGYEVIRLSSSGGGLLVRGANCWRLSSGRPRMQLTSAERTLTELLYDDDEQGLKRSITLLYLGGLAPVPWLRRRSGIPGKGTSFEKGPDTCVGLCRFPQTTFMAPCCVLAAKSIPDLRQASSDRLGILPFTRPARILNRADCIASGC